jgi:hypothetical protein
MNHRRVVRAKTTPEWCLSVCSLCRCGGGFDARSTRVFQLLCDLKQGSETHELELIQLVHRRGVSTSSCGLVRLARFHTSTMRVDGLTQLAAFCLCSRPLFLEISKHLKPNAKLIHVRNGSEPLNTQPERPDNRLRVVREFSATR